MKTVQQVDIANTSSKAAARNGDSTPTRFVSGPTGLNRRDVNGVAAVANPEVVLLAVFRTNASNRFCPRRTGSIPR